MVNMDVVKERLIRGAYVGLGSFASGFVGNKIAGQTDNQTAIGMGQVIVGGALSVGSDEVFDSPRSVPNDMLEYVGYGIQGSGWDEVGESLELGFGDAAQTGARVIDVSANAGEAQRQRSSSSGSDREIQMEVA